MLVDKSIFELAEGFRSKKWTIVDLVTECIENIKKYQPKLNACITVLDEKKIRQEAEEKQKLLTKSSNVLYGIPFIMKDSYLTKGIRTTAASKVLDTFIPPYSATVYEKLIQTGAILVAKANMDAWGHGATSENTDYGPVKNPWNTEKVAGGSSGGCAAAISSGMAVFGIGEDTGGSIRNPASWCNITGLKVTYGRVSRYGCISYASSFDTVGPMAKTAVDCALVLENIAGQDRKDSTSSPKEVLQYSQILKIDPKAITIGVPRELFETGIHPEIATVLSSARHKLQDIGFVVRDISMPSLRFGVPVYYLIAPSETSSNLARYDGVRYGSTREGFTKESMRRIMIGTYALSAGYCDAYYKKAQQARTVFIREYEKALHECDSIFMPVTPYPPTSIGQLVNDPVQNMLVDMFTVTQNPVGVPSLALPAGFTKDLLPIGFQLVGSMFREDLILAIGHSYQEHTDWHTKKPSI